MPRTMALRSSGSSSGGRDVLALGPGPALGGRARAASTRAKCLPHHRDPGRIRSAHRSACRARSRSFRGLPVLIGRDPEEEACLRMLGVCASARSNAAFASAVTMPFAVPSGLRRDRPRDRRSRH